MSTPRSQVGICNMALMNIGVTNFINAIDDGTPEAECCSLVWDDCLEMATARYAWPWAIKQAALTVLSSVTRKEWEYVYSLPTDCLVPLGLVLEDTKLEDLNPEERNVFDVVGNDAGDGKILVTDLDSSNDDFDVLLYIAKIDSPPAFSATFSNALAWLMSSKLALGLKKDPSLSGQCLQMYEATLVQAAAEAANGRQRPLQPTTPSIAIRE